jgi:hypothetical protein
MSESDTIDKTLSYLAARISVQRDNAHEPLEALIRRVRMETLQEVYAHLTTGKYPEVTPIGELIAQYSSDADDWYAVDEDPLKGFAGCHDATAGNADLFREETA